MAEWVGYMRHGQAFRPGMDPEDLDANSHVLTKLGAREVAAVAGRLREELETAGLGVSVVDENTPETRATKQVLEEVLADRLDVTPAATVIVGHDPAISQALDAAITNRQPFAGPVALARGELGMVIRGKLRWILSPSDKAVIEALRAKIKSKMETAKLLGAFLTAVALLAARELARGAPTDWYVAGPGVGLLALSIIAYFVTMFRYDELLMPETFWAGGEAGKPPRGFVTRPPSSAKWVLYQNMIRIWFVAFIPATLLGATGATLIGLALAHPRGDQVQIVGFAVVAAAIVTAALVRGSKPSLGVSD